MKDTYTNPEIQFVTLDCSDIITASNPCGEVTEISGPSH